MQLSPPPLKKATKSNAMKKDATFLSDINLMLCIAKVSPSSILAELALFSISDHIACATNPGK